MKHRIKYKDGFFYPQRRGFWGWFYLGRKMGTIYPFTTNGVAGIVSRCRCKSEQESRDAINQLIEREKEKESVTGSYYIEIE